MPDGFPCPNPTCTHVFPAAGVKGRASLTCPRCATVFHFAKQPATPKPPPPPPRPARPAPPVPVAAPVAPPAPVEFLPDDEEDLVVRRDPRRGRSGGGGMLFGVVMVGFLASFVAAGAYVVLVVLPSYAPNKTGEKKNPTVGNFTFRPPAGYSADEKTRKQLDANLAVSRSGPRCQMALAFTDYKTRVPADDELMEEGLKRLKAQFRGLEYTDPILAGKGKEAELGDEQAWRVPFQGRTPDEVPVTGECLMLTRRGLGYWFVAWGPSENEEELTELFEKLRGGVAFGDDREGWKPSPRVTIELKLTGLPVALSYPPDVWRVEDAPKDYDPAAEAVLRGFESSGKGKKEAIAGKSAVIQVLVLPAAADLKAASAVAQEHVRKRIAELDPMVKLEPYVDPKGAAVVTADVGELSGEVRQLDVKVTADRSRFGLIAVANQADGVLAIYAECPAEKRGYWLGEFKALLASARAGR